MKIAYVYESGFTLHNGSNHLHYTIIKKLLSDGNEVHLIQSIQNDSEEEYPGDLNNNLFYCHSIKVPSVKKSNFIKRYLNGLHFCKACKKVFKSTGFDLFFIQCTPTANVNIKNAKKFKRPIVYNIYDVFPGSAYALGIIKSRLLDKLLKIMQRSAYKKADRIIVMSDDMKTKVVKEKVESKKVFVVNSWYDSDSIHFVSEDDNSFVKEFNIDTNKLLVQYAGNIGQVFAFEEFSSVVRLLKDNTKIEFHIIGDGAKLDNLKKLTEGCENIKFFGWQSQARMNEIYSYCDIEIIPLRRGVIGNNVPSKTALALACGKPIISIVEESSYFSLFPSNGVGFSFKHNQINELVEQLIALSNKKHQTTSNKHCVSFSKEYYSKEKNLSSFVGLIYNINDKG